LSPTLSTHDARTIQFYRDLCLGFTLTRLADRLTARRFLLDALRGFHYPELMWHVPGIQFMLAYEHATEGRGVNARQAMRLAKNAIKESILIGQIQELWIGLSIPIWTYAEIPEHKSRMRKARKLLESTDQAGCSPSVMIEVSRLAAIVAQHDGDLKLGLYWLDRLRQILRRSDQFDGYEQSEYHMQRLILFNRFQLAVRGIREAKVVLSVSPVGTVHWYNGASILVNLLLKCGRYLEAFEAAREIMFKNGYSKRASEFATQMNLRTIYTHA